MYSTERTENSEVDVDASSLGLVPRAQEQALRIRDPRMMHLSVQPGDPLQSRSLPDRPQSRLASRVTADQCTDTITREKKEVSRNS